MEDDDGRGAVKVAVLEFVEIAGAYRIEFDLGGYARAQGREPGFFSRFTTDFEIQDVARSYHVPLIVSPHSGITYLGS